MNFSELQSRVAPFVYKIETSEGQGTGFQMFFGKETRLIGIVTAKHVVEKACLQGALITLTSHFFGTREKVFLKQESVQISDNKDLTFIELSADSFSGLKNCAERGRFFPGSMNYIKRGQGLVAGNAVGWLGFPGIAESPSQPFFNQPSFFTGYVDSMHRDADGGDYYLIDGTAIGGVSGGPVFCSLNGPGGVSDLFIAGVMVAYCPNIQPGGPCVSKAILISEFENNIKKLENLEEAKRREREEGLKNHYWQPLQYQK